jgi:hypothetical protein
MKLKSIAVFFVILLVASGSAFAHHHNDDIDAVLKAIDIIPTRAQLDEKVEDAQE